MRAIYFAIAVVLLSTSASRAGEGILWHRDLDSAKNAARQTNRPILVHFWSPSCAPCVKLEQDVYSRPEVKHELETRFVLAKLNVDDYPATASNFGVKSWPADVILAPDGQLVTVLKCPLIANQYLAQLGQFGGGATQFADRSPRSDLSRGAMNLANSAPAATAILQTSAHGPAVGQAPALSGGGPPAARGAADLVERYDFRSAPAANTNRGGVQPPQAQQSPLSQGPLAAQQQGTGPSQQPQMQPYDLVPALAAPPIGLDGYCPVGLSKVRQFGRDDPRYQFTKGDPRFGVVHRGRTYLFSGAAEQQEFLREPDRYSPVMGGNDPVLFFDEGRQVAGDRSCGCFVGDRVYLFASKQSLAKFLAENDQSRDLSRPNRYSEAIYQAENPGRGMLR